MTSGHRTLTAFLAVICSLVLAILGLSLDWPPWLWCVAGTGLLAVVLLALGTSPRPYGYIPPENTLEPDVPQAPPRQEQRVRDVALPSALPDYDFLFSATIRWVPEEADPPPYFDPGALAMQGVVLRARAFAARQDPRSSSLAQHQLSGVLGVMEPDPSCRVIAMAKDVRLTLSETDQRRLSALSDVRKDEEVWEHERNYERSKRTYLTDDVLKDPGSAVVWWLARNGEQVEHTVERIGLLARLSAAANNSEVVEPFRDLAYPYPPPPRETFADEAPAEPSQARSAESLAEDLMSWLGLDREDPTMRLLADRFADYLRAAGKKEEADDFAEFFRLPEEEPSDDPPEDVTP
ncbi:hypothetical protein [Streptomyces avicenniae]|uniref:hypothetical protein n=1 Tax=Streptomyces avicenniae TaxID=500153 RepID=UPI00069A0D00|nr:hypothetical protein [Streptomyces avicenniae]